MKTLFTISKISLIVFFCLLIQFANAAKPKVGKLDGTCKGSDNAPLSDAILQLFSATDSSLIKTEFSGTEGEFAFTEIKPGDYFILASVMGYKEFKSNPITIKQGEDKIEAFVFEKHEHELKEFTVTARKAFVEREAGKTIMNVENSITAAGSSALELIAKAPGVMVDNNENISLNGKAGVAVWIDGKPSPLTGANLANYLKGMPSGAIEKIEFITNPSSKYDAAGSSIINIKLKKDKRIGANGSITLAYAQGIYPKSNNSAVFSYRNKKISAYTNYSYAYRKAFTSLDLKRSFYPDGEYDGSYIQNNFLKFDFRNHIARTGIDYTINNRNTIGIVLNGVSNRFNPNGNNVSYVYNASDIYNQRFETQNRSKDNWYNGGINTNYKLDIDSAGSQLTADLDYVQYGNSTQQNFTTNYYNTNNNLLRSPYLLYGNIHGKLKIYSAKTDFTKIINDKLNIETGLKSSFVKADNNLAFYDKSNGDEVYDSTKSNHFIYTENINSAYVNINKKWKKLSSQFGLRAEQTNITGIQLVYNSSFKRNYIQLFPSINNSYAINDKHSLELNIGRRITRPGYDQLNPFKFYLDPTTYKAGNPYLQPSTTQSVEFTYNYNQKFISTVGLGRTHNNIIEMLSPSETENRITVQTNKNLHRVDIISYTLTSPIEVTKWWYTNNTLGVYHAFYSGNLANTTITNTGNLVGNINSINTFTINDKFSAELSGFYQSKEIYGFENVKHMGALNLGAQYKCFQNKGVIKLNANDILYSSIIRASTRLTNYYESFVVKRDSRQVVLSFTYAFGNNNVKAKRHQSGAEDIKQRAGGTT